MKKSSAKLLSLALSLLLVFSASSAAFTVAAASLGKVSSLSAYNIDDDEVNLKWKKVNNATGYQVYAYRSGKWNYEGSTKKLYFEVDELKSASKYKFKVRAYQVKNSKKYYGNYSSVLSAVTKPDEVDNLKVSSKSKNSVSLKWSAVRNADGYQVYQYDSAQKKYVKKATVKKASAVIKNLKAGYSYSFKVRAYFKLDSKAYYGEFSDVVKVKTNAAVSQSQPVSSAKSGSAYIGASKAGNVALNHAGLKKSQVRDYECSLDYDYGVKVYEVSFEYGRYEYEYEINAVSGKILHYEKDYND